ncbi:hypothetical protein AB205_0212370 [Aquarana catesbeiana]|uniref:Uncharacterized protein n=1 Tax=Aquarana catesbeiana TaxID=8400 RepID=A0A2G9RQ67_AQUCT|nr:hypothetical protein AB205_0212370 [Aquarana catesbeiana]
MMPNMTNYTSPTTTARPMSLNSTTVKTEQTSFVVPNETSPSTIVVPIMSNLLSNTTQANLSSPALSNPASSTLSTTITVTITSNYTNITLQGNTVAPTVSNNTGSTSTSRTLSLNTTILQVTGTILSNTTGFTSLATKSALVTPFITKTIIPNTAAAASNVTGVLSAGATTWPAESNTADASKWPSVTRLLSPATTAPVSSVLSTSVSLDGRTATVMSNVSQYSSPSTTAVAGTSNITPSVSLMPNINGSELLDSRTTPITSQISMTLGSTTVAATMNNTTGLMSTVNLNMSLVVGSTPVPSKIFGSSSMATKTAPMISDVADSSGTKTTDSISNKSAVTLTSTVTPPITTNISFVGPPVPPTAPIMIIASTSPVSKMAPIIYTVNGASSPTVVSTISDTTSRPSALVIPTTQYTTKDSLPNLVSETNTIPVMSGISGLTIKPSLEKVSTTGKTPASATSMLAASTTGAPSTSTTTIPSNTTLTITGTTFSTGTEPVHLNFPTKTSTASTLGQVDATKSAANMTNGTTEIRPAEAVTLGTYETNSRGILALRLKLKSSAIYPFTTQAILKLVSDLFLLLLGVLQTKMAEDGREP